jgi:hypothetical protein
VKTPTAPRVGFTPSEPHLLGNDALHESHLLGIDMSCGPHMLGADMLCGSRLLGIRRYSCEGLARRGMIHHIRPTHQELLCCAGIISCVVQSDWKGEESWCVFEVCASCWSIAGHHGMVLGVKLPTPPPSSLLFSPLGCCSCRIPISCDLLAPPPPLLIEGDRKGEMKEGGGGGTEEGRLHHDFFLCTHHYRLHRLGSSWRSGQC